MRNCTSWCPGSPAAPGPRTSAVGDVPHRGAGGNRLALFIKSHQALINGVTACEIGHVIADRSRRPADLGEDIWLPAREALDSRLAFDAVGTGWPGLDRSCGRCGRRSSTSPPTRELSLSWAAAAHVARRVARRSAPDSPLNTTVSRHRWFTVASASLADFRRLLARYDCDVNDIVLTVIAGALRNWLLSWASRSPPA